MFFNANSFADAMLQHRDKILSGETPMGQDLVFNPMNYDMQKALEKMPTGWYRAQPSVAVLATAEYGMGLDVTFKIVDGPYKDRVVKKHYNIRHTNPKVQAIAEQEVATLCGSMNLWAGIQNTDQLTKTPLQIRLTDKIDSRTGEVGEYNDIKGYKDINGNDPVKPGTGAAMTVAAAPAMPAAPAPAIPSAAPALAKPTHDHRAAALADGWQPHPSDASYLWKGNEALPQDEVYARYPAPGAAPAVPAIQAPAFAPPQQPGAAPAPQAQPWTPNQPGGVQPPVWKPGQ